MKDNTLAAVVVASFCAVIAVAVYVTHSAWPLFALVLFPSIKTGKAAEDSTLPPLKLPKVGGEE